MSDVCEGEYHYSSVRDLRGNQDYIDYLNMYATFLQMLTQVRWINHPDQDGLIPRLQPLFIEYEADTSSNGKLKLQQLKVYQKHHVELWINFSNLVTSMSKNKYLESRLKGTVRRVAYIEYGMFIVNDDPNYCSALDRPRLEAQDRAGESGIIVNEVARKRYIDMLYGMIPRGTE